MWRSCVLFLVVALSTATAHAASYAELFPTRKYADAQIQAMIESFDYKLGTISLVSGAAKLELEPDYYFLAADDARAILGDFWGFPDNPDLLGAVLPIGKTPVDGESWAAEVTFDPMGRVSDTEIDAYAPSVLLEQMQMEMRGYNATRQRLGYPVYELVGWTQPPIYDAATKKLHWASELMIDGKPPNTLNYEIRVLGRTGVLAISFVSSIGRLDAVKAAAAELLAGASFASGHAYADFNQATDAEAEFSVSELIVGQSLDELGAMTALTRLLNDLWFLALIPVLGIWWFAIGRKTV